MHTVLNLATGETLHYSCEPSQAVICAFEQARANFNTWQYLSPATHPHYRRTKLGHSCGDWAALDRASTAQGARA